MRVRQVFGVLMAVAVVAAVGCGDKASGPTPADTNANTSNKVVKDKSGKVAKGAVDDSFPDPNYKK